MPNAASKLPQISRFLRGLVTNRVPTDSPHGTIPYVGRVSFFDALIDGSNVELSAYDTIQRRPGFQQFGGLTGQAVDIFQYKDLNGAISLFTDTGSSLNHNGAVVKANSSGATYPWSLAASGNFLYASDGIDQIRIQNTNLTTSVPYGQSAPQVRPVFGLQSLGYFNAVTGFAPSTDAIVGTINVEDGQHNRTLTITINPSAVHFNVTYSGNLITQNNLYTQVTAQTQTGTAPNTTTTDVVTTTSGLTSTVTGTGISNGVMNWYQNTGISTLDFDYAYGGSMTLSGLSAIIVAMNGITFTSGTIPYTAYEWLQVFITTSIVSGLWHSPGQSPVATQSGLAMNITVPASLLPTQITVTSGLFDTTNPQLSLAASIGVAPRLYQYQTPIVNVTDTFTGTLQFYVESGGYTAVFSFVNKTMQQIINASSGIIISGAYQTEYVQSGTTCYGLVRSINSTSTGSTPSTSDNALVINTNTMVNLSDPNQNMQTWTFLETNDYCQLPQQGVEITYAVRDTISGGLSNVSPALTVGPQQYPCRWNFTVNLPSALYDHTVTNLEVYRTVDGGSSYLYEQTMIYQNPTLYTSVFNITDDGLNEQLVGPINETNDPPPIGLRQLVFHTGRMWGILGNKVYYSGGPDTLNGNGDESWPPGNYFQYPGLVTDIKSITQSGLAVALTDDLHIITGVDTSSYYTKLWIQGFGISTPTAWVRDAQSLYVYTSKSQLHELPSGEEIGFDIGDKLATYFNPASTSLTFHRSSALDTALYLSNGIETIARYNPLKKSWSPLAALNGIAAGRVKSLETTTAVQTLLMSNTSGVWARNLNIFTDNGNPYSAFFTIGVLQLAPPGQVTTLNNIAMQAMVVGTLPQVWLLLNEINSTFVPFTQLFQPVNDPPDAPGSQSLWAKRWYVEATIAPFPTGTRLINLASVKVVFSSTDTVKNEVTGIFLREAI